MNLQKAFNFIFVISLLCSLKETSGNPLALVRAHLASLAPLSEFEAEGDCCRIFFPPRPPVVCTCHQVVSPDHPKHAAVQALHRHSYKQAAHNAYIQIVQFTGGESIAGRSLFTEAEALDLAAITVKLIEQFPAETDVRRAGLLAEICQNCSSINSFFNPQVAPAAAFAAAHIQAAVYTPPASPRTSTSEANDTTCTAMPFATPPRRTAVASRYAAALASAPSTPIRTPVTATTSGRTTPNYRSPAARGISAHAVTSPQPSTTPARCPHPLRATASGRHRSIERRVLFGTTAAQTDASELNTSNGELDTSASA